MENAATIIDALGGTVAVARALNLAPTTVSSWKGSKIPSWRMEGIAKLAKKQGVNIAALPTQGEAA